MQHALKAFGRDRNRGMTPGEVAGGAGGAVGRHVRYRGTDADRHLEQSQRPVPHAGSQPGQRHGGPYPRQRQRARGAYDSLPTAALRQCATCAPTRQRRRRQLHARATGRRRSGPLDGIDSHCLAARFAASPAQGEVQVICRPDLPASPTPIASTSSWQEPREQTPFGYQTDLRDPAATRDQLMRAPTLKP